MKVYVKKTETKFGEQWLYKWTKQNRFLTYCRKFRKWASERQFALWLSAGLTLFGVAVFLGFLIAGSVYEF